MINLVIDSTHYRQDRNLNREDLSRVKEYGKNGFIQLYIPYVVFMESKTATVIELQKSVKKSQSEIQSLSRKGLHQEEKESVDNIEKSLNDLYDKVHFSVDNIWKEFITESKAILLNVNTHHTEKIFEAYFHGKPPFAEVKNRKDIPDAFIYYDIIDLAAESKVYIITNDGNLSSFLGKNKDIKVFSSFEDFFNDEELRNIPEKLKPKDKVDLIGGQLLQKIPNILKNVEDYFYNRNHVDIFDGKIPSDNEAATIIHFDEIQIEVISEKIDLIDWRFFIPMKIVSEVEIEYYMYVSDYLTTRLLNHTAEQINKHAFLVNQSVNVEFEITAIVRNDDLDELTNLYIDEGGIEDIEILSELIDENFNPME